MTCSERERGRERERETERKYCVGEFVGVAGDMHNERERERQQCARGLVHGCVTYFGTGHSADEVCVREIVLFG